MTITTALAQELQNLDKTSGFVEFYILDCSNITTKQSDGSFQTGTKYFFTPNANYDGTGLIWQGQIYTPLPISSQGWDISGSGTQPRPTITISNVHKMLLTAVVTLGDIVGATLTRYRTFAKFIDGGSSADPNAYLPPDIFVVEQKLTHEDTQITWQLASVLDRFGMMLPRRQVLKDQGFPGVGIYRH